MPTTAKVEPSNRPCSPATCSCIPTLDLCFYREYLIDLDISALEDFPPSKTACTIFITVLNNAELSTRLELEVELNAESPDNSVPVTADESKARFASVPVVAVVIIVVVIVVVMHRQRKFTKNRKSSKLMNLKNEFALTPQGLESFSRGNSQLEGFDDNEHAKGQKFGDVEEHKYQSLPDSRDTTYQSLDDVEDVKYESLKKADKPTTDSDGTGRRW
ncbi:uncharacterized protein [Ptychodera flava]|uniref:uncharacterized protein n=1 Tax=Ptychodera flava TaxID=63121 RepID=UPI00396A323B